jgi:hypothetical protein
MVFEYRGNEMLVSINLLLQLLEINCVLISNICFYNSAFV